MAKSALARKQGTAVAPGPRDWIDEARKEMDEWLAQIGGLEQAWWDTPMLHGLSWMPWQEGWKLRPFGHLLDEKSLASLWREPFVHWELDEKGQELTLTAEVPGVRKGDIVAQFRQVCANIQTVLNAAGGDMADVVKLNIYVLDVPGYKQRLREIGAVYREYFGKHFPAMTLVGARDLFDADDGCLIEIEGVAALA